MLEKITNISAGSDYKNATSKTGRYSRASQFINVLNSSMTDSISLSPAVSYLNSLNWKLKRINKIKENLIVIFEYDGYEFTANVGYPETALNNHIDYLIKKFIEKFSNRIEINISLETPPFNKELQPKENEANLFYLNLFVDDLLALNEKVYQLNENNYEVMKLFNSRERNLKYEFNTINENLFHFIEKYLSIKLRPISIAEPVEDKILLRRVQLIK